MDITHLDDFGFNIAVADDTLADLRARIARTRWPVDPLAPAWRYGTDGPYLRGVADHWLNRYDWRTREAALNRFRQFRIPVGDIRLHVVIEPGSGTSPIPLLLLNGWPSAFTEFAGVIEPLAHPEAFGGNATDGFTVIVISYPGFGFSDPPPAPMGARAIAAMLAMVMDRIVGTTGYGIHGGDWGAIIASWMAFDAPDRIVALHLNSASLRQPQDGLILAREERAWLDARTQRLTGEMGYQAIQSTRPQSLGYALTDSPVGLAGWVLEKFQAWTVPGTAAPPPVAIDTLLDIVMVHWLNGINAANWLYCDLVDGTAVTLPAGRRVETPTALLTGGRDLSPPPPPQWVRRSYALTEMLTVPDMGHFPSIEASAPTQIAHLRDVFRRFR